MASDVAGPSVEFYFLSRKKKPLKSGTRGSAGTARMESEEATQLPSIDFSGVDPSTPGSGSWAAVRAQVMDALTSSGCFVAHYPPLTPELRAALFDGAVKPLFALPVDAKRRNYYGDDKPYHGYIRGPPGRVSSESLAIVDGGSKPENVRAFADLVWPDGSKTPSFRYDPSFLPKG